ncbi:MAG: uracil-DNA glycosylase [Firmicutes bacterium]|nr:uracil-DNA glycosylase [Bacillota bacterium]
MDTLEQWRAFCLQCRRCPLRQSAKNVVFGEGSPRADIMFIGEGPGAEEDRLGHPFVGAAGRLLDRILAAAGWSREEIYIANIVKCRPPGNRQPQRDEIEACYPLLQKQIELIDPPIIICLGAVASKVLLKPDFRITKERGNWHEIGGRMAMPTFHPAALLRDPKKKRPVWEDIQQVMAAHKKIVASRQAGHQEKN